MSDWKIFRGDETIHDGIVGLPDPPPWRFPRAAKQISPATDTTEPESLRAASFRPTAEMIQAVNAALYLRRPLLLSGKPGGGKSTLISKVANELRLGRVLRWPINSRSTVKGGVYDYDAVGRLQAGAGEAPPVQDYLRLGPLGTALIAKGRPCALLVDEIDKSDLDFANDLLNVIEDGEYEIAELKRLRADTVTVLDHWGDPVTISNGRLAADHFPFVIMTSNAEREFPAPFLRRCIRLDVAAPDRKQIERIIEAQLSKASIGDLQVKALIDEFLVANTASSVSTDQLLNAIFLTVTMRDGDRRTFDDSELAALRATLMRQIGGATP
ncbi:AAA family ATPase [Rhizobium ruizarguesonis]|uniref:AAA family ATPase n=1 Tax=Rhizobium ruizarguesonis TaxID=2081791 RepID=UPI0013EE5D51|nr:MoxR family ATPase [Rhizobium ruizarguesonis]